MRIHASVAVAALIIEPSIGFVAKPIKQFASTTLRPSWPGLREIEWSSKPRTARGTTLFSGTDDALVAAVTSSGNDETSEDDCSPIFEDACLIEEEKQGIAKLLERKPVQLSFYLFLWYFFNAGFNVTNKQVLNKFPHPWIVAWFQLATGLLWVLPSWKTGIRQPPIVDAGLLKLFIPIALLHSSGHGAQVASMGLGTVFFTHVIKAAEPFIGTLVVLAFTGKIAPWYVNICLAPVVGGVAYAAGKPGMAFDISDLWSLPSLLALLSTVSLYLNWLVFQKLIVVLLVSSRLLLLLQSSLPRT